MSFEDRFRKKVGEYAPGSSVAQSGGSGSTQSRSQVSGGGSTAPQSTRTTKPTSFADRFTAARDKYSRASQVDQRYIDNYIRDYNSFLETSATERGRMGYGNAAEVFSGRQRVADDLKNRRTAISQYLLRNQGALEDDAYRELEKLVEDSGRGADSILKEFTAARDRYSYDFDQGSRELERLEKELGELEGKRKADALNSTALSYLQGGAQVSGSPYGANAQGADELESLISAKRAELTQAQKTHAGHEKERSRLAMTQVGVRGSGSYDPLYASLSGVNAGEQDSTYRWINDAGFREEAKRYGIQATTTDLAEAVGTQERAQAWLKANGDPNWARLENANLDRMTDQERALYRYHYAKGGAEQANAYLAAIAEELNYRKAQEDFAKIQGKTGREYLSGIGAGLDQFAGGITGLTSGKELPTSAAQFRSAMVRDDLKDDGFNLWYNFKEKKWENRIGDVSTGQIFYDSITTTANMAPSILTSAVTNMIVPGAGAVVGNLTMNAGAAGNARQEALREGYGKEQATAYGLMVGAAEAVMEKILGGIGAVGGQGIGGIADKLGGGKFTAFLNNLDTAMGRVAVDLGESMLSEGTEEYLQEILDPLLRNAALGEENGLELFTADALYSGLLGAISGGLFETPNVISGARAAVQERKAMEEAMQGDMEEAFQKLNDLGIQNDTLKSAIVKKLWGKKVSKTEQSELDGSEAGQNVLDQMWGQRHYPAQESAELPSNPREFAEGAVAENATANQAVDMAVDNVEYEMEPETPGRTIEEAAAEFGEQAGAVTATFAQGQEVEAFTNGFRVAYDMGRAGISEDYAMHSEATEYLTEQQRHTAWLTGKGAAQLEAQRKGEALPAGKAQGFRKGSLKGVGVTPADIASSLNAQQRIAYKTMAFYAEVTGTDVVVYRSQIDEGTGRVTAPVIDGVDLSGANGAFNWKNDKLYIDLNAGVNEGRQMGDVGRYIALRTFGHEFTHSIEKWNPQGYEELRTAVFEAMTRKGVNVDALIQRQMLLDRSLSYDKASREAVAEAMSDILRDSNFAQELAQKHGTVFDKLRAELKKLVKKLRSYFGKLYANRDPGAKALQEEVGGVMHYLDEIVELYDRVAAEAVENRQAARELDRETAGQELIPGEEGAVYDADGEPVAAATADGTVQLSIRTYEERGREQLRKYLGKAVKDRRLTRQEARELTESIEEIYGVCKEFKDRYAPFSAWSDAEVIRDTRGRPVFSVVTPNGDYRMNLDFSLVCKKRRTLDAVFNEMAKMGILDDFELGQKSVVKINEIIRSYGLETACSLCFVDAKRFRQAAMADSFVRLYNDLVRSMAPEGTAFEYHNFGGHRGFSAVEDAPHTWSREKLDFSHLDEVMRSYAEGTVEHRTAKYLKSSAAGRKLLMRGDFMGSEAFGAVKTRAPKIMSLYNSKKGTGGPRAAFGDVQYLGEILSRHQWKPEAAYDVGGIRIQSFSDYVPRMVFDYVQMLHDLAARKLPAHAYTKEALFARQFGLTGVKVNMSLIPAVAEGGIAPGLDADGNYVWAGESFDFDTAKEIQRAEGYSENCGTICVGVSDPHIRKLLADPDIRMVIPYHKSGLNPIVAHMNRISAFADYTDEQRTRNDGKAIEKDFDFNRALRRLGDPRQAAQEYLSWCEEQGYTPKFPQFVDEENYYKLLTDFTVYDEAGAYVPQREVRAVFPREGAAFGSMKELIAAGLQEDAVIEGRREQKLSAIIDEIRSAIPRTEAEIEETPVRQAEGDVEAGDVSYSRRTDSWGKALTEDQEEYFENSRVRDPSGRLEVVFHGSRNRLFTEFRSDEGIWMTTDLEYAREYADVWDSNKLRNKPEAAVYSDRKWRVYRLYANITNPLDLGEINDDFDRGQMERLAKLLGVPVSRLEKLAYKGGKETIAYVYELTRKKEFINIAREKGYDGFFATEAGRDTYCAFEANQVKLTSNEVPSGFADVRYQRREAEEMESEILSLREEIADLDEELEFAEGDAYRRLAGQRAKKAFRLKELTDRERKAAKKTPMKTVLDNLSKYRRTDLESIAEQLSDGAWDDIEELSRESLEEGIREIIEERGYSPIEMQVAKYGVYVRDVSGWEEISYQRREGTLSDWEVLERAAEALGSEKLSKAEQEALAEFRGRLEKLEGLEERRAEQGRIWHDEQFSPNGDREKARLARNQMRLIDEQLRTGYAEALSLEDKQVLRGVLAQARDIVERQERQEADRQLRVFRREQSKLRRSDVSTMEREFLRLVREYEKSEEKAGRSDAKAAALQEALGNEIAAHKADQEIWDKEFRRLMREYDRSGRDIGELEQRLEKQKKLTKSRTEGRQKTALRHSIQGTVQELERLLLRAGKDRRVKEGMRPLAEQAIRVASVLFTDIYNDEDLILNGLQTRLDSYEKQVAQGVKELLEKKAALLSDEAIGSEGEEILYGDTGGYEERMRQVERLDRKIHEGMRILRSALERERSRLNETTVSQALNALAAAYRELGESDDLYIRSAARQEVWEHLGSLSAKLGGTVARDMTLKQLEEVKDAYQMVLHTVRTANELFALGRKATAEETSQTAMAEIHANGIRSKLGSKLAGELRRFGINNLKPVYFFEHLGSKVMRELYQALVKGQSQWATDVEEARRKFREDAARYGYDKWDFEKRYKFKSVSGKEFELNLQQIMSLFAYYRRPQARDHINKGGIVIDPEAEIREVVEVGGKLKVKLKRENQDATAYNIDDMTLVGIVATLTKEQQEFVKSMQTYLSTVMGGKGNEVSMRLYGIKQFKEENYFPLRSARQYLEQAREQAQNQQKVKNAGFTKDTVVKASNPVILGGFMDVWAAHVDEMSLYHAMTLPMEDLYRVYNYGKRGDGTAEARSMVATLQNAFGKEAVEYLDTLLKDLNSSARVDHTTGIINRSMSLFKKGSTFLSASVVVQQPSAIVRATAMIDSKYFRWASLPLKWGANIAPSRKQQHDALWAECKKYAPVALIKEMGYFDTSVGRTTRDYITAKEYSGFREKMNGLIHDSGYRDEIMSRAPALADELGWCAIWEAVKREQHDLHPGMRVGGEEFLKLCGDRFTEVIDRTQVYDSVLSRSANMRSKDTGMKMATAFLAEPTVSINMVADAILKAKRGDGKYARRAVGATLASGILNAMLYSLVAAARDDDDDEEYWERYLGSVTGEVFEVINPATYLPFARDVMSLIQGYDVERSDMALVADLVNAVRAFGSDKKTGAQKVEQFANTVLKIFGLPLGNIGRDVKALYNVFENDIDGHGSTAAGIGYAIKEQLGLDTGNGQQMYESLLKGDTGHYQRVAARYESESSARTALRKAIRENDKRIREAAVAWNAGELEQYMTIAKSIIGEKHFSQDDVVSAIMSEAKELMPDEEGQEAAARHKGLFTAAAFTVAASDSDSTMMKAIREDLIVTAESNGKTRTEAEKSADSAIKSELKDCVLGGILTERQAREALVSYCGERKIEAEDTVREWVFEKQYGYPVSDLEDAFVGGKVGAAEAESLLGNYGKYSRTEAQSKVLQWKCERETGVRYDDIQQLYVDGEMTADKAMELRVKYGESSIEDARKTVLQWQCEKDNGVKYSDIDVAYLSGEITEETAIDWLVKYGEKDEEAAALATQAYRWKNQHTEYKDLSDSAIDRYIDFCEGAGISIPDFYEARKQVSEINEAGGTIKANVAGYIRSLPLSKQQKWALWYALKTKSWKDDVSF